MGRCEMMAVLYQHWGFIKADTFCGSTGERESWYCKHCKRNVVIMSYRGRRNINTLEKPCYCVTK